MSKPRIALKVRDLPTSIAFYVEVMDFKLADAQSSPDLAYLLDTDGDQMLLAGPGIEDVKSYLDDPRIVFKPGDTLDIYETDFAARLDALLKKDLTDLRIEENPSGDRKLILQDPNGYVIVFIAPKDAQ
ncbi:MAG TPA: VOC family protein [Ktedonobacteraceae bacterium]|nr:VOC family protein [Ktedonobacteraceae bacterium]